MSIKVHVRAPVLSLTGYGVHSRQVVDFLMSDGRFDVFIENINWGACPYIHHHPKQMDYYQRMKRWQDAQSQGFKDFDMSIHISIPNEFARTAKFNIGITAGIEVDRITKEWIDKCNQMDYLVVPSEFSKAVMNGTQYRWKNKDTGQTGELKIQRPIAVMSEWFQRPEETITPDINITTDTNFLHVGLWGTKGGFGEDRKNIADLVRMFYQTFQKKDDSVGLILKTGLINNSPEDYKSTLKRLQEIKQNFKGMKNENCKVYLLHDTLSEEQLWGLYGHPKIDAFVSFTHGEGFGLPLLEAHAAGLPVIATDWSGHKDFLNKSRGYLPVEFELGEIPECQVWPGVIDKGSRWAKVDEKKAMKALRKFTKDKAKYKKSAKDNVSWLEDNFSRDAIMVKWKEFFDQFISEDTGSSTETAPPPNSYMAQRAEAIKKLEKLVNSEDEERVLFSLPRSAGDTLIATAIVDSLILGRHFDTPFYFATNEPYTDLLNGLKSKYSNFHVIRYENEMMNHEITSEVFDYVYNPGVNIQYNFSNWLLGNGEYSVRLLEEFAKQCNLHPHTITDYVLEVDEEYETPGDFYVTFSPTGTKQAKHYSEWPDVILNMKEMFPGVKIAQTGLRTEKLYEGVEDCRGLSYAATAALVKGAAFHLGVDTLTAHMAAAVGTPHVVVYGSTSATTVSPVILKKSKSDLPVFLVETSDRHGCKNPCYKDACFNLKNGKNCLSEISPKSICNTVMRLAEKINEKEIKEQTAQVSA